jgi:transposase
MGKAALKNKRNLPVCLMFQDEARFGRMSDPRRCWAPLGTRPKVISALVREYSYIFGAICPKTGHFDYMKAPDMKTPNMSLFLRQVSRAHPNRFVIMVVDGASTHKAKDLVIPGNVALIILPPYSPELNPSERLWNKLRRDYFANHYFATLDEAMEQVDFGLGEMKSTRSALRSLTLWPWIKEIVNAT